MGIGTWDMGKQKDDFGRKLYLKSNVNSKCNFFSLLIFILGSIKMEEIKLPSSTKV